MLGGTKVCFTHRITVCVLQLGTTHPHVCLNWIALESSERAQERDLYILTRVVPDTTGLLSWVLTIYLNGNTLMAPKEETYPQKFCIISG